MRLAQFAIVLSVLALTGCKEKPTFRAPFDAGLACGAHERLINGECIFVCERDGDCGTGKRCNLLTGTCEAKPPAIDAGVQAFPCTNGAERCSADAKSIERCTPDGTWTASEACPPPAGFCLNERCLSCQPGSASCDAADSRVAKVCLDDGSGFRTINCSGAGVCNAGECRECIPDSTRCSVDGKAVQVCKRTADETLTWKWVNDGDAFDGSCITQVCEGAPARCRAPTCFPGTTQCKNTTTQQVCSEQGSFTDVACSSLPGFSPSSECQNGVCFDECADAVKAKSYFGCEYWSAILDNSVDPLFKGKTLSGMGTSISDFAFVVTNRSTSPATVDVWRYSGGVPAKAVSTVTVPPRTDPGTKGLMTIKVPWQSVGPAANAVGVASSGIARYGYRLTSNRPVTVYQFNPLDAVKYTKACTGSPGSADCNCNEYSDFDSFSCMLGLGGNPGVCDTAPGGGKKCKYNTFSNDASLLLPAHILGTSHVVMSVGETAITSNTNQPPAAEGNGMLTIVGTQDGTTVTVKTSAKTAAGGAVAAMNKGDTVNFTLNSYDVLQIVTTHLGASYLTETGSSQPCASFGSGSKICRVDNDLTGTVVLSTKPVAVFGGSACMQVPFDRVACDHVEEQIFPFATWGKQFVAVRSNPLRLTNNSFQPNAPDVWKIVASCPASQCPAGTLLTLSAPPAAADVFTPNRCVSGTLAGNNCRLVGGAFMEFKHSGNFTVTADNPIAVGQFFAGQGSLSGLNPPVQGDPSMVLLPPAEQWRSSYTVLAAPGIKDNYLGLAIDDTKVLRVEVDGVAVSGFTVVSGTSYVVKNHPISVGTHTINVVPKSGVSPLPGAGVTVYGYDSYVSYGYTGGLDLGTIVTGINPGG